MKNKKSSGLIWILVIACTSLIIHLLTFDQLGFHRDELLYLALGKHPAAGYWSNPPLIGIISYLSQLLPWDPLFNTRFIPALTGALLIVLTGLIAFELGGGIYSAILSSLVLSFSLLILRGYSMLQPVPFDILFWTLILYFLLKYIKTGKFSWIVAIGVATGFAMLNKYIVAFLVAAIVLSVVVTKHRNILTKKYFWISVCVAFIIFLPNLVWQVNHKFPVFFHMRELNATQLVNVDRANIIFDQLLMFTFGSFIWVAGVVWLIFAKRSSDFRLFGIIYLTVLSIFVLLKGKSYYTAGLYPFLFAAGGVAWENMIKKTTYRVIFAVALIILSLPLVPAGIPLMKAPMLASWFEKFPRQMGGEALLRWEDGKIHSLPQDFADMLGWNEMARIVIDACESLDKERIMIYGENYGQAGAIDLYGEPFKLPRAASFSDSYLLWLPDSLDQSKDLLFYINDEPGTDIFPMFEKVDSLGSVTNRYAREFGTTVYLCYSPNSQFFDFYSEKVKEAKSFLQRNR